MPQLSLPQSSPDSQTADTQFPDTQFPDAQFAEMVGRWCALALRRHAHFTDLYESGRWQRYYTEHQFVAELRKLMQMVERWRALATDTGGRPAPTAATGNGTKGAAPWHRAA